MTLDILVPKTLLVLQIPLLTQAPAYTAFQGLNVESENPFQHIFGLADIEIHTWKVEST